MERTWRNLRVILPHPTSRKLLLCSSEDGWALPSVDTPRRRPHRLAGHVALGFAEQSGATVTTLRCARFELDAEGDRPDAVFVLENHDPTWKPPMGARWVDRAQASELTADGADHEAIVQWFDEAEKSAISPLRPPWERTGWYGHAVAWAKRELTQLQRPPTGQVEQVKHWNISSILRIETTQGDAWLKAVPQFFAHEGALIQLLAPGLPSQFPNVLAAEPSEGWLLMDSIPGEKLSVTANEAAMAEALRVLARLQQVWAARVRELFAVGCPDRRLRTLDGALEELLARADVRDGLSSDEVARLTAFASQVPDRREALADCGVPETLVHGDFHAGNVAVLDGGVLLYDWTDGCVAHPFVDLATFIRPGVDLRTQAKLVEAYLDVWSNHIPRTKLETALTLAGPIACLHHALSLQRIVDGVETPGAFAGSVQDWLRRLLAAT